jgi:hypothetical protein
VREDVIAPIVLEAETIGAGALVGAEDVQAGADVGDVRAFRRETADVDGAGLQVVPADRRAGRMVTRHRPTHRRDPAPGIFARRVDPMLYSHVRTLSIWKA